MTASDPVAQRLEAVSALLLAAEKRGVVLDSIASATSREEAVSDIATLLSVERPHAERILDARLDLFASFRLAQLKEEFALLEAQQRGDPLPDLPNGSSKN